jgi:hypothetical protein
MQDPTTESLLRRLAPFLARGVAVWAVATLALRLIPSSWFALPPAAGLTVVAASSLLLTFAVRRILKPLPAAERPGAAAAFAAPGLIGDALVTGFFATVFPNMPAERDGLFGALMLWGYGVMVITGLAAARR